MRICISETRDVYELSLREWSDGSNRYGQDLFDEYEHDFPNEYPHLPGDDVHLAPLSAFLILVEYWANEKSPSAVFNIELVEKNYDIEEDLYHV